MLVKKRGRVSLRKSGNETVVEEGKHSTRKTTTMGLDNGRCGTDGVFGSARSTSRPQVQGNSFFLFVFFFHSCIIVFRK